MAKPIPLHKGVMIYYEIAELVEALPRETAGELFAAILMYAQYGTDPSFDSETLRAIWPLIRHRIDSDQYNYKQKVIANRYSGYCSACRRNNLTPVAPDTWRTEQGYQEQGYEEYDDYPD